MDVQNSPDATGKRAGSQGKRLVVRQENGLTIYYASGWPGWGDVLTTFIAFVVVAALLAFMLFFFHLLGSFSEGFFEIAWLNKIMSFIFVGSFDLSLIAILAIFLLWMPYFLVYQLSPKRVWIEDRVLCHSVRLLWLIRRTRRIAFDRIAEIEVARSGRLYHLKAIYEMDLPRWLFFTLTYWNEKFSRWPLTLINAFPTRDEAEWLQNQLLESVTKTQ